MFENLKEMPVRGTVEWEAMRVAQAFGVGEWIEGTQYLVKERCFSGTTPPHWVWRINSVPNAFTYIDIETFEGDFQFLQLKQMRGVWHFIKTERGIEIFGELMARGLFCLGFDDADILAQLPQLTEHEKLELRLSLPKEFWPPQWEQECQTPA